MSHLSGAAIAPGYRRDRRDGQLRTSHSGLRHFFSAAFLFAAAMLQAHASRAQPIDLVPYGSPHWVPFNRAAITMPAPIPVPGWSDHRDAQPPSPRPDDSSVLDLSP